jgi:hypothetical protein
MADALFSVGGFLGAVLDPVWFVQEQIPQKLPVVVNENSLVIAWQLGNLYLLMAFLGVGILTTTSELKVVKAYLFALWLGDIGHVAFTCWGLGKARLMAPLEWNAVTTGNVTFTVSEQGPTFCRRAMIYSVLRIETEMLQVFLFAMRSAYFLGAFGPPRSAASASKKTS